MTPAPFTPGQSQTRRWLTALAACLATVIVSTAAPACPRSAHRRPSHRVTRMPARKPVIRAAALRHQAVSVTRPLAARTGRHEGTKVAEAGPQVKWQVGEMAWRGSRDVREERLLGPPVLTARERLKSDGE